MSKRNKQPSDTELLDWVAVHVSAIDNTAAFPTGVRCQVLSYFRKEKLIIARTGKTASDAFRKCVTAAMREMPSQPKPPQPG